MATIVINCTSGNVRGQVKVEAVEPGIVTFHIYHDGRIEKHIPKFIKVGYEQKYKYVYHGIRKQVDKNGKEQVEDIEIDVCTLPFSKIEKRKNGIKVKNIPEGAKFSYEYPKGGDAKEAYIDSSGTIYVSGKRYGKRAYPKGEGKVELVKMPDSINKSEGGIVIKMSYGNTQRRYCNPETMAGFIGVMATISKEVVCTGMCFEDGTSYPSLSHPNGDSADTRYYNSLKEEQEKVNAFRMFHFLNILRGNKGWQGRLSNSRFHNGHDDHLHAGDFQASVVKVIKE